MNNTAASQMLANTIKPEGLPLLPAEEMIFRMISDPPLQTAIWLQGAPENVYISRSRLSRGKLGTSTGQAP